MFKLPKKIFRIVTPPLIGLFFIYVSFYYTSEEERSEIYKSFKEAKFEYIFSADHDTAKFLLSEIQTSRGGK